MKIHKILLGLSALFILLVSSQSFSFEGYNFSPMDEGETFYGDEGSYYNNDRISQDNDYQYIAKKKYSYDQKSNGFTGAGKTFVFDPKQLRWFAFYNGNLVNSGRASGGRFYCPDVRRPCKTPVGVFRVGHKGGPDCKSSKYPVGKGNAPMPWCMFFHRGFAIHGGPVPSYNASHGCIRVERPAARWLSGFLNSGSRVVVRSYH